MRTEVVVGNGVAFIDSADAELVGAHRWRLMPSKKTAYAEVA